MNPKINLCLALLTVSTCIQGMDGTCEAAIIYPKAPVGGRQIVYEHADEILRGQPGFLGGFRIGELTIAEPHREYFVGLNELASGNLLSSARPGGWLYLLLHGTDAVGAVELIADEKRGKALQFNGLFQTNFSVETLEALRRAEKLSQIKEHDYELRRLDIPGESFVAVWLHAEADDILIPLPPTFGRLNDYQPYSESQIIKVLQPAAEEEVEKEKQGAGGF